MERGESRDVLVNAQSRSKSQDIVSLRPVAVKRVGESQVFRRRPVVRNKDGIIVWQADPDKFSYRDESTGKLCFCSCSIHIGTDRL